MNSNVLRGALAEFIVENALRDSGAITIRNPWGDYDVLLGNLKIEVKCCSYIQDWDQNEFSRIAWCGLKAKHLYWSSAVGQLPPKTADYKSDIYILALLNHQDPATLDILDMKQWCFFVLSKKELAEISKNSNSISLQRLRKAKVDPVSFERLSEKVNAYNAALSSGTTNKNYGRTEEKAVL